MRGKAAFDPASAVTSPQEAGGGRLPARSGPPILVETVRLAVVVLATSVAFEASQSSALEDADGPLPALVITLGVALGYVAGGVFGRFAAGRIDATERRLRTVSAGELLATVIGGLVGLLLGAAVTWPVLLFGAKGLTIPLAALTVTLTTATGMRVGAPRGGDLLRFVGASGRLGVMTPSSGAAACVVDTSALIDGRLLDVCRSGFLAGTLVVPRFVLYELQGLADAADQERRARGRRGLDVLAGLQRSSGVAIEVPEDAYAEYDAVDAKLVAMARRRGAALVTVDGNLGRVAEVQDVRVLNLHALAETLRPPVLPGDLLEVRITKGGREPGQGVGYLADGTMVVVEGGRERQGTDVTAEVTSILSNPNGRMVFATLQRSRPAPVASIVHP